MFFAEKEKEMKHHCANCGQRLSEDNIRLALEDAGTHPQGIDDDELEHFSFCCPDYSDESGCPGYAPADEDKAADWYYRG